MPQFPHEEVAFESGINVRFTIYNSNNDYIPEHWHRSMEVIYIYEGSMELIEGQRVLLLHAGDYHVVNSAAVHATRTTTPSRVLLLQIPYAFLIGAIPEYESVRQSVLPQGFFCRCADSGDSDFHGRSLYKKTAKLYSAVFRSAL